jgi:hypothetical protein
VSRNPSFFYAFTPRGIPHFVRNDHNDYFRKLKHHVSYMNHGGSSVFFPSVHSEISALSAFAKFV